MAVCSVCFFIRSDDEYTRSSPVKTTQTSNSITDSVTAMHRQNLDIGIILPPEATQAE
jgi:hypothetical protein